ncbi:hypothetical protein AGDE_15069 [Angomonas deanei]|uniref:Uncharacterized protein n=1 Tax=Angomonas deanei TaxID=59799 RepID=A0A7G2CMS8_9TRYP|nr:hypothetical protein AGDE_15069 [Angomonas deanei]CAD2221126.1 hypothetical protein, conserved [Angomonas deanei]|eukprot:EPY19734.1 hypothetical protein AGDE_15069 [Angomonas deanei]
MGMFSAVTTPIKGRRKYATLVIRMSAMQMVVHAMSYGGGSLFTMNTAGGSFEVFSGALFSLFLDCCSLLHYGKEQISFSEFFKNLSQTKIKNCSIPGNHDTVKSMLFANYRIDTTGNMGDYLRAFREISQKNAKTAFVVVNGRGAGYADLIAKSGDTLFVIQCKSSNDTPKIGVQEELCKMGFSDSDNENVESFVHLLDLDDSSLNDKVIEFIKGFTLVSNQPKMESSLFKGKVLTRLLMKALGCKTAVPVFICSTPKSIDKRTKLGSSIQNQPVNSFGWKDPAALLFVGGGIERSGVVKVEPQKNERKLRRTIKRLRKTKESRNVKRK